MDARLNVAHAAPARDVNGPGLRFTVWAQGCALGCPGCFNPGLQPFEPRRLVYPEALAREGAATPGVEGVSLTGGEPFAQAAGFADFLAAILPLLPSAARNVVAFTGYPLEELREGAEDARRLLSLVDLLVDGPYRAGEGAALAGRGSANQRLLALTPAGETLRQRMEAAGAIFGVVVGSGGETILSGFPPPGVAERLARRLRGE